MLPEKVGGFFAYPSTPASCGDAIRHAVDLINSQGVTSIQTWEECRVGGKLVVDEICKAIDSNPLFCADLTGMNANVMFELGFAIARNKRIWLLLDPTYVDSKAQFEQLRVLTTVGYVTYSNYAEIMSRFNHDQPYSDLEETLYNQLIRRNLPSAALVENKVLYLKSLHETEASVRITNSIARLEETGIPVVVDDPKESAAQSLTWYGTQVHSSATVICHLTGPNRINARLHDARNALVAGMALGMGKSLLMLVEGNFLAPIDYRDLLLQYNTASEAEKHLLVLTREIERASREKQKIQLDHAKHEKLVTELRGLQVGEYIAENEAGRLVEDYFVETSAYREALTGNQTVFVGRKGAGKTANLLKLASELGKNKQNLVCVIKPPAYELDGVLSLFRRHKERDAKGYAVESLWKFLILTEIANVAAESAKYLPSGSVSDEEASLRSLVQGNGGKFSGDFAVRLERCVGALVRCEASETSIETTRTAISEALHQSEIHELREVLGKALSSKERVAILIDNLDKPWGKQSDFNNLAEFLLGLLGAANRLILDFRRADSRRRPVNLSLAVFLRSDIFDKLMIAAREPDKIPYSRLRWGDHELLVRVIEERFVTSHAGSVRPEQMWKTFFCENVKGIPTKEYFVSRILPRPRDLVFFVKAAMATAVNRNHTIVSQQDILDSEKQYSQFAFDSILVETGATTERMEDMLYEFVGSSPVLTQDELESRLSKIGASDVGSVIELLCSISFLGLETRKDRFRFVEELQEYRKALTLAQQVARHRGRNLRYRIHPAFSAFLELSDN
jgi:hypothetical protein